MFLYILYYNVVTILYYKTYMYIYMYIYRYISCYRGAQMMSGVMLLVVIHSTTCC